MYIEKLVITTYSIIYNKICRCMITELLRRSFYILTM